MILDEPDHSLPAGIIGPLVKKHHTKSMPIIINLSGGQISNATYVRTEWNNIVSKLCKQSSYDVLIISSAGNEGIYLTKDNIMEYGILPSTTKPKSCKNDIPIISVGGTNKYNKVLKISPDVYKHGNKGSNYGKNYVNILSPGDEIPMFLPDGRSFFSHGSSPATAITTGTIALMLACKPLTKG